MGRGCFGIVNINKVLAKPDDWIRRGLQMLHPGQWKRGRTAFRALSVRGASKRVAAQVSGHSHRWWRTAREVIHHIPGQFDFDQMGFLRLDESLRSIEPPWYGPVCSVVWEGNLGDFFLPGTLFPIGRLGLLAGLRGFLKGATRIDLYHFASPVGVARNVLHGTALTPSVGCDLL
ncbi:MAG: hypothetical protein ACI9X4_001359 [Glaciecola sp.]|jgi:hypothetical protein